MRNIKKLTRRHLIKTAAAAGVTLPLFNIISAGAEANEKLKAGFIGMGRMNYFTLRTFMGATKVLAVCDVDTTRRTHALETVNKHYGNQDCKAYIDYRDLLAREDIDLVVIGTPDHWHATITIDAARVGKDIYCEKPLTHDIEEAIRVMQEVEKAGVVLQTGSHQRSQSEFRIAAELVRNNVAGKVKKITSSFWGPGQPCNLGEEKMEPGLDWNRWLGPAPMRPYHSTLSPRGVHDIFPNWRAYREFGGGGVCDMGAHHLDIIQWAMEMDKSGPVKALPNADLSNDWGARLVYANGIEVVRSNGFHVDFECENGRIQASRGQFRLELDGKSIHQFVEREDGSLTRALVFYRT